MSYTIIVSCHLLSQSGLDWSQRLAHARFILRITTGAQSSSTSVVRCTVLERSLMVRISL